MQADVGVPCVAQEHFHSNNNSHRLSHAYFPDDDLSSSSPSLSHTSVTRLALHSGCSI